MSFIRKGFQRIRYFLSSKAIVLSYHRVAKPEIDPWEISVSPTNFDQQMQVLKKYQIITTAQLLMYLETGKLKDNMVCITFDDGYQDNYNTARPILEKYNLQSTFYIPLRFIGSQKEFWWDELQSIIFCKCDLPQKLSISIAGHTLEFDLEDEARFDELQYQKNTSWAWFEKVTTKRAEVYLRLWEQLRPLEYGAIEKVLDKLKEWSLFASTADSTNLPMSEEQLHSIISHPLFDIGIHTVTHPGLAYHGKEDQYNEISTCKKELEALSGHTVNSIAYPYGIYNEDTIEVVKELGVEIGFTTQGSAVQRNDHPLTLARYHVKNWNGNEFEKRLRLWTRGF
jgi:peptidoglycan/xylan/chitin deacetylase (PgdA/CDA1 family)